MIEKILLWLGLGLIFLLFLGLIGGIILEVWIIFKLLTLSWKGMTEKPTVKTTQSTQVDTETSEVRGEESSAIMDEEDM